ncbi:MAG: peptidase C11 [Clostridia bacterium]|nr:peptidase C11 [Clostridia bacterium]
MDNRPSGRKRNVSGTVSGVNRRGSGLGTGKVGNTDYSGKRASGGSGRTSTPFSTNNTGANGSSTQRAGLNLGKGSIGLVIVIIIGYFLLKQCGGIDLLGGGDLLGGADLSSLLYQSAGISESVQSTVSDTVSSVWNSGTQNNTTTPDTTVASGVREKYTEILGGGKDVVTLMMYMCGTDLESKYAMASKDIQEMCNSTLSDRVNVIVYTGGTKTWQNKIISNSKNQIYRVVEGGLQKIEDDIGTGSMASPDTLASFVKYCAQNFPANRYQLIMWDHGGGTVSGVCFDEKSASKKAMSLTGIQSALKSAGVKFDFIGFDACLMGTLETGTMLSEFADYMIASEETEPGIGWYYTNWLSQLSKNTSVTTLDLGKTIIDDFTSKCEQSCRGQKTTLSLVDLAELSAAVPQSLSTFSEKLSSEIKSGNYSEISKARATSREFSKNKIDQVDLVHFALNTNTSEGKALADKLLSAIKYNRTSSDMTNAYGLSVYFPYQRTSYVDSAVSTNSQIGMSDSYSTCIKQFASLEVSGQAATGGTSSPLSSLSGSFTGSSSSLSSIGSLLGSFLGGDFGSIEGLSGLNTGFLSDRAMTDGETAEYIAKYYLDTTYLTWKENKNGDLAIGLADEKQWELVTDIVLNTFYDDGKGYIDLGTDKVLDFDGDGYLLAPDGKYCMAVNGTPVAFYYDSTQNGVIYGYIPALLNGERVELLVQFVNDKGYITGANTVYDDVEVEAKNIFEINEGDTLVFIADYYTYRNEFVDAYEISDEITVPSSGLTVSDVVIENGTVVYTYRFTDIYSQNYWSEAVEVR